ncbi:hypothetical protein ACPUEK_16015 [Marinomonas gallaica]|uniref:hypothetical protein n=1 Tax=Marinomonas gallaica TaxID=1806667 RepID=UPI003CE52A77
MKLPRPFGFSLLANSRRGSGTTDPHLRLTQSNEAALHAPSGAFLIKQLMSWDDPELCRLVDAINQQFGQLGDTSIQETRQDADSLEKILDQP